MQIEPDQDGLQWPRSSLPVLVVDDYGEMRGLIRSMLSTIGCDDIVEDDGRHALELLHERQFGLILADLCMEPVGGLALLRAVRGDKRLANLPFIMVTATATRDLVLEAKQLDIDGYLVKPFTTVMLTRQAVEAVRRRAVSTARAHDSTPRTHDEPPPRESVEPAELRAGIAVVASMIERRIAAAELTLDAPAIALLEAYLQRALELGLEPHHARAFAQLCGALQAGLGGDPQQALSEAPDDALDGTQATDSSDKRQHRRFVRPVLEVTIEGNHFRTVNWSCHSLCLEGYRGALAPGRSAQATIRSENGEPSHAVFHDKLTVVRCDGGRGTLSAAFEQGSWTGLKLLEQLIHRRIVGTRPDGLAA